MPVLNPDPLEMDVIKNRGNLAVKLYTNPVDVTTPQNLSAFTIANFDGYEDADPSPMQTVDVLDDHSQAQMTGAPLTFVKGAGDVGNVVYGYLMVIKTTAGPFLIGAVAFPNPVNFLAEGDTFTFIPVVNVTDFKVP